MKKQIYNRMHKNRDTLNSSENISKSPSSRYSSKNNQISAKLNSSKKRKHFKDLDKVNILSSLRQPKTMSSLTSRNMVGKPIGRQESQRSNNLKKSKYIYTDNSATRRANRTNIVSNESIEGNSHISAKTDTYLPRA
jgi:hypothetical protein